MHGCESSFWFFSAVLARSMPTKIVLAKVIKSTAKIPRSGHLAAATKTLP
jgi:hypothetical protein